MKIDAHQHFWKLSNPFTEWPTPAEVRIYKDFGADDLAPLLSAHGVSGTILVQAAPVLDETHYLLKVASRTAFVKGVVGWVDFEAPSALRDIEDLALDRLFRGVRPMLQSIADPGWMLDPRFTQIFECLAARKLTFDALILPVHLASLNALAARQPHLSIIIDHAAKPAIHDGIAGFDDWATGISRLAEHENVTCKVSGLLTEAQPGAGLDDLRVWLDHLYAAFGPERLLWGSDWPVVLMEASYSAWLSLVEDWLSDKPAAARDLIFGGTAKRVYSLTDETA